MPLLKNSSWLLALPLILGLLIARLLWPLISLPFSNPWQVTGPLTQIGYNPLNDILRFGLWIGLPLVLLMIFWFFSRNLLSAWQTMPAGTGNSDRPKPLAMALLLAIAFLIALNLPTEKSTSKPVDSFHEGEALGPAVSLLHGKAPYRDILFLHGPYQDPLRAILAFRIWGKSIGALRSLESVHKIIAMLTLALFCLLIMPDRPLSALILFLTTIALQSGHKLGGVQLLRLYDRDMTTFAFLIICTLLERAIASQNDKWKTAAISFGFAALPIATFAYSIDRGFFLTAAMILLWPLALFSIAKSKRPIFLLFSGIGCLAAGFLISRANGYLF